MPRSNLSTMSVDALLKLKADVETALNRRVSQLEDELSKLSGHNKKTARGSSLKGRKVAIKYRDKSGNTWAGRGVQPRWLRDKIKAGAKLEQFAVNNKRRRAKR
jgi:DNA-binding protein H-NS